MVVYRVAVIGAGAAGLAAARQLSADPQTFSFVVYEQADELGGTWVYSDDVGTDKLGEPVHSSIYKSLRTNLPKEVMGFPDFPIPEPEEPMSYLHREQVLIFLNSYADHFNLKPHIKFRHRVQNVSPREDGGWNIDVNDVLGKRNISSSFDAVLVCNGHYTSPFLPELPGQDSFQGQIMHCHDYRIPDIFRGKRVVVVGAGPSGLDLTVEISSAAQQVVLSHHYSGTIGTKFADNVRLTSDIKLIKEHSVEFQDGTSFDADVIFLCTGYLYAFPFLAPECGIRVEDNQVMPLYKHVINIEHPTMALIALPFYVCAFSMSDLQVRFFLKMLTGEAKLPTREEMLADTEREMQERWKAGLKRKQAHMLGVRQAEYYNSLAEIANIKPIPNVLPKLHGASRIRFREDLVNYRNDVFRIVDDENYIQIK